MECRDVKYYLEKFKKLNCAFVHGHKILAKPFLILAIIEIIGDGRCTENKFEWEAGCFEDLKEAFEDQHYRYQPNNYLTPIFKPFYHLSHDGFWHLNFIDGQIHKTINSNKSLRDLKAFAHLDPPLWDLLQNASVRDEFREQIINFFIKKKTD